MAVQWEDRFFRLSSHQSAKSVAIWGPGLASLDLPTPIGPLTPAHDLCGYPSGLEGLGACAPAQSRYSFHDGLVLCFAQELKPRRPD